MFLNAKKPTIRKVVVQKRATPSPAPPANRKADTLAETRVAKLQKKSRSSSQSPVRTPEPRRQELQREEWSKKRKTTPLQVLSSDDDSSDGNGGISALLNSKRAKVKSNATPQYDEKRKIWRIRENVQRHDGDMSSSLLTGAAVIEGKPEQFKSAFTETVDMKMTMMELRYPGSMYRERFMLAIPYESDGYKPLEDIIQSVEKICQYYLSREPDSAVENDSGSFSRKLKRAVTRQSLDDFIATISDFNTYLDRSATNATMTDNLKTLHHVPLPLVERITSQIYSRTVSPRVESLRRYENGTDNVYGELLPRFVSQIFKDANLTSDQTFIDLGSGVGNVVLQAALEIGCESWGCEIMPNPCKLARLQADEFRARVPLWGIASGEVNLVEGNFLTDNQVAKVLARADVILVNNQAFTPGLNDDLVLKFLDLKEGARLISLKSFVPSGFRMQARTAHDPRNLLDVRRKEYGSCCVSWTDSGGEYFVAVKDSKKLEEFQKSLK